VSPPPVYRGPFGKPQAERLLWRAGFGPRKGEAESLAKLGLAGAVHELTNPGFERLVGPKPHDDKGHPLAPYSAWGHDHAWWLDRMVRTSRPLVERMTLIWHDWFATSNDGVGSQRLMLEQNELFRRHSLGSFHDLLRDVTANPAMLEWLNGLENEKGSPNENYGREMMELFTLGADRGAYTERDVREQARALTGWQNRWKRGVGAYDFHFDASRHDTGMKRVFGKSGNFDWRDACSLCLSHSLHPSFFVQKLWSYFVPTPPDHGTQASLEAIYKSGYQVKPVVSAILSHPALFLGPRLVKPPIVHTAGLLRRLGEGITTTNWAWIGDMSGQRLFYPPNVAGWDDTRWLDTATFRGRWYAVQQMLHDRTLDPQKAKEPYDAEKLVARAVDFWSDPPLSTGTQNALLQFARHALADAGSATWKQQQYPVLVQNALRQLVAMSPDLQTA
jgi:uncharacterized protein (DUF1800 family)